MIGVIGFSGILVVDMWANRMRLYISKIFGRGNCDSMLAGHIELVSYDACHCRYITSNVLEGISTWWSGENMEQFAMLCSKKMAIHCHPKHEMRNRNIRISVWAIDVARFVVWGLSTLPRRKHAIVLHNGIKFGLQMKYVAKPVTIHYFFFQKTEKYLIFERLGPQVMPVVTDVPQHSK